MTNALNLCLHGILITIALASLRSLLFPVVINDLIVIQFPFSVSIHFQINSLLEWVSRFLLNPVMLVIFSYVVDIWHILDD